MPVDFRHPSYVAYRGQWLKCRNAIEGEEAVKQAGDAYLPRLTGQTDPEYDAYKLRSMFYGASGRTVKGLSGAVMRKPPQVEFPKSKLEYLKTVGDGGESLQLLAQQVLEEVMGPGRVGVLVEAGEEENSEPYICTYYAENIINWKEELRRDPDGKTHLQLTMVVIYEEAQVQKDNDRWETVAEERIRVLELKDNLYVQELYLKQEVTNPNNPNGPKNKEWNLSKTIEPKFKGGNRIDYIPFCFVNPTGITAECEKSPLIDLVNVNLAHYRNSADLEHGRHFTALPQPWLAGWDNKDMTIRIGSSKAWVTENSQAQCGMLEFTGNGLGALETALDEKQKLMAVLGARLLEEQQVAGETATAVRLRQAGEKSILATVAGSVSEAITKVLRWLSQWALISGAEKATFVLNEDYEVANIDGPTLTALFTTMQSGGLSFDAYYGSLEKGGVYPVDWTMEKERSAIEAGVPMGPAGELTHESKQLSVEQQRAVVDQTKGGADKGNVDDTKEE